MRADLEVTAGLSVPRAVRVESAAEGLELGGAAVLMRPEGACTKQWLAELWARSAEGPWSRVGELETRALAAMVQDGPVLLATAGVPFLIGVPGADDVMLGYQSLSFHDALYLREVFGLRRAPEFEAWLARMELTDDRGRLLPASPRHPLLALHA